MPWDAPNFPVPFVSDWPMALLFGLAMLVVIGLVYYGNWRHGDGSE